MLLAEDLLLLLTDDTSGQLSTLEKKVDFLLAGANLVELTLVGRVEISREVKRFVGVNRRVDRLVVRDPSSTGDAVLDAALHIAIRSEGRLLWAIRESRENLSKTLYMRSFSSGMVRHERRRTLMVNLGLTTEVRWPVQDSRHKVEVRRRVIEARVGQTTPDTRSAALIALLHTIGHPSGKVIASSSWAPEAVRDSIDAIIATTEKESRLAS